MTSTTLSAPLWVPDQDRIKHSLLSGFLNFIQERTGTRLNNYSSLYTWSINEKELFWSTLWDFCQVQGIKGDRILVDGNDIERAKWFPDARLNYAQNLLTRSDDAPALHFRAEDMIEYSLSFAALRRQVASVSAWLRSAGIGAGDRVAGYLPNMPETIVAMLASASIGAVWTSTSPDFGVESVVDRFGQTGPRIMFCADGYYYNGKRIELQDRNQRIRTSLPSIERMVTIPLLERQTRTTGNDWDTILVEFENSALEFTPMGFNDPLCILYSSGTTGKPKCITHKVGGVLLQHLKEHQLHCDIQPDDRVFYFTTCGWMMWNWLASALASKATLILYDGAPFHPAKDTLWRYASELEVTLFGTSAKYIDALKKSNVHPSHHYDLSALRTICSTGSVLAPESFDYVYESIKADVCLSSISGGTDIISCFILGCPTLPVYRGECQCRGLGMATAVYSDEGEPVTGEKGELVCTETFPSQPVYFWDDPDGSKYHSAYFSRFDNVWHHGDYVQLTDRGTMIIYGRSDATLNPGGVRIGTAEIYRHVEQLEEVVETIVIGQDWDDDTRIVLFVVLQNDLKLSEELQRKIRTTIREKCSPRHVPAIIIQVAEIPRTKSGKIVELAVREVVHNREVKNINSLANPDALELYRGLPELQ